MLECGSTLQLLLQFRIVFVRYQTFHHVAVFAVDFVAVALHGRATVGHDNGIQLHIAGFVFGEFTDGFLL